MKKIILLLFLSLSSYAQTYPLVEEFNVGTTWTYTNGAGRQNYGGVENYATFNIGSTPYPNNSSISITSPTYDFTTSCSSNLTVSFPITGRIENGFDFVYFEYYDGGAWVNQATFTSVQNSTPSYSIPNTATQFRFVLITDCSVNGYKGGNPSCNLSIGTCTPIVGNCSGLTSVYYYDITRFAINCTTPLPVTILKFDARCVDSRGVIEWTTISEYNNDYFTIEKSVDGIAWRTINTIKGNDGYIYRRYSYTDTSLSNDYTYYRLSQTDFNGDTEYIGIRAVLCNYSTPAIYYNLQGLIINIEDAPSGVYIKKEGNNITKIIK